ncbi:sensor histidine kinase [Thalassotalea montiporae]
MKTFVKIGRSFLSLYFLITLTFIVASWLLDEVWNSYMEQDIESYTGYKTMLHAIGDYVTNHPQEEWQQVVENAATRYHLPLSLVKIADIESQGIAGERRLLGAGNTYVYIEKDTVSLHHLIAGSEFVITLGPTEMPTRPRAETMVRVLVLIALAVMILVWLWPISRDLHALRKVTKEFGTEHFDVRAQKPKSIMMAGLVHGFNAMAERIKDLVDAHKELTTAMSHELRTPLARSKFALQMLSHASDETKRQKYVKQICGDINELESLVNELLEYASLEDDKPKLNFGEHNLDDIISRQIGLVGGQCVQVSYNAPDIPVIADCDRLYIERALSNYISNAIKYGDGLVVISCETKEQDCVIKVEDNGNGVDTCIENTLFDAFSRADDSRNKETGGFGLGLAIVKRVLEWHGGRVYTEKSRLGGACFVMQWPIKGQ